MEMTPHKVAVIGAGISGLSVANFLKDRYRVTVFEKEENPGGLIRCCRVNGNLFHTCGGHVFNSKRQDVLDWFWSRFSREEEFSKADRNSCVFFEASGCEQPKAVPYPIENHVYYFDEAVQKSFYQDLEEIDAVKGLNAEFTDYDNFGDFLRWRFGRTLYDMYFEPYNQKVWRRNLSTVPMSWMKGKLPMPTTHQMRDSNANKIEEKSFVHSSFWYEKQNGSQHIADRLAEGLDIRYRSDIQKIKYENNKWFIGVEEFDKIVFCGNIKNVATLLDGVDISEYVNDLEALEYHGTTAVFCEIDANPYSWIYLPSRKYESHRIICTGNFASGNNDTATTPDGRITATIEFTDSIDKESIEENLKRMPLHPKYLDHKYNKYTYPIQDADTRAVITRLKSALSQFEFYFTGRFADWEYYNMDVAMGAAMDLCKLL